ncbi:MAG: hypothetical protein R3C69_06420 [Geminicoccaceae bacterium]
MITFLKMHGLGNDFVVLDGRRDGLPLDADLVRRLGDRHRGIGFDQLALLSHSEIADVAVRFYNPDGSEAGACGNASRCIAALVGRELDRRQVTLATAGGALPSRSRRRRSPSTCRPRASPGRDVLYSPGWRTCWPHLAAWPACRRQWPFRWATRMRCSSTM